MTSKAHVKHDIMDNGVKIAVTQEFSGGRLLFKWGQVTVERLTEETANAEPDLDAWLPIPEDAARAMYEALAEYFGHTGHDIRALRKDYDAERVRVDRLIGHLMA